MANYFEQKQFFKSIIDLANNTGRIKLEGSAEERKQTLKDNLIQATPKTYKRKQPPTVTIVEIVEDSIIEDGIDKDNTPVVGYVSYLNEYGSKGVMPWKMFMEMYEESE